MKPKSPEIRNSKFGKIRFVTKFEKWHSDSEFEEQNSAVCSNIRQHSPSFSHFSKLMREMQCPCMPMVASLSILFVNK